MAGPSKSPHPSRELTPRENQILNKFLENGCSDDELAKIFGITYTTAKTHMVNLREKLGYGTREELAVNMLRLRFTKAFESV